MNIIKKSPVTVLLYISLLYTNGNHDKKPTVVIILELVENTGYKLVIIIIRVFCPRAGLSLQTPEPVLSKGRSSIANSVTKVLTQ